MKYIFGSIMVVAFLLVLFVVLFGDRALDAVQAFLLWLDSAIEFIQRGLGGFKGVI
jgi:hypothetical protein